MPAKCVRQRPAALRCGVFTPPDSPAAPQALVAAIRGRAQQGSSFLDALAAKHGGAAGKRSSKRGEPSDSDFTAAQARMKSRR